MADNDTNINVYQGDTETRPPRTVTRTVNGREVTHTVQEQLGGDVRIAATDSNPADTANGEYAITPRNAGVSIGINPPAYDYGHPDRDFAPLVDANGQSLLFRYQPAQIVGLHADPEVSDRAIQQAMAVARRHVRDTYGEDITNSESLSPFSLKVVDYAQKRGLVKSPPSYDYPSQRTDWNETKQNLLEDHEQNVNDFADEYFYDNYENYRDERDAQADECHDDRCEECHGENFESPGENCGYCYDCEDYKDEIRQNTMDRSEYTQMRVEDAIDNDDMAEIRKAHLKELRAGGTQGGADAVQLEKYYNSYRLNDLPVAETDRGVTTTQDLSEAGPSPSSLHVYPGRTAKSLTKFSPEYIKDAVTEALQTGREFRQSAAQVESDTNEAYKEYAALKDRNADDKDLFGNPLDPRTLMSNAEVEAKPTPKYRLTPRGSYAHSMPYSNWEKLGDNPNWRGQPRYTNVARLSSEQLEDVQNDPESHAAYEDNRYTYDELYGNDDSGTSRLASFSDAAASPSNKPTDRSRFRK